MFEVTQADDKLKVVWAQEYVLVMTPIDAVSVVTGTIEVDWLVETDMAEEVIVTMITVGDGVLVVTGEETGWLIVDMLQLGAAATEAGGVVVAAAAALDPYPSGAAP